MWKDGVIPGVDKARRPNMKKRFCVSSPLKHFQGACSKVDIANLAFTGSSNSCVSRKINFEVTQISDTQKGTSIDKYY